YRWPRPRQRLRHRRTFPERLAKPIGFGRLLLDTLRAGEYLLRAGGGPRVAVIRPNHTGGEMRTLIGVVLVLAFSGFAVAQDKDKDKDKIDAKKLIGKWEPADSKDPLTVEFTDKGKLIFSVDAKTIEGTYKLDGNKLEMVLSFGGKE